MAKKKTNPEQRVKMWRVGTGKHWTDAGIEDVKAFMDIPLSTSRSLKDCYPKDTTLVIRSTKAPSDYIEAGPFFVITDKLRAIFDEFKVKAEYFPLLVRHRGRPYQVQRYFHCNTLVAIDCLDWKRSEYTPRESVHTPRKTFATEIQTLLLDMARINDEPLFRIERTSPSIVCVSRPLADRIAEAKCTGMEPIELSDWTMPGYPWKRARKNPAK